MSPLTDYQFRLLVVLCHKAAPKRSIQASAAELGIATGNVHEKTVRRALKALEEHSLISRTPTKKAGGMRGVDKVFIHFEDANVQSRVDSSVQADGDANVQATGDYVTISKGSQITTNSYLLNSYKLKELKSEGLQKESSTKEIKVPMAKWVDDGDNLAGFGLVEEPDAPQPKIKRNDPKTRGRRPEHEWTPMDVAAEFSYQVGRKYPLLPGTVNVKTLSGALAKFRKQYDTTPLIELELLRLFMEDEHNFKGIGSEAPHLYKMYLASFGKKINQARENLGLGKVTSVIDTEPKAAMIAASDGRVFQNTMSGRAQLERYEQRLKGAR